MLKMTRLPGKPAFSKNNGSKSASSKNNDSKLEGMIVIMRLIDLVLMKIVWSTLKSQKNCLSQENQKVKKYLILEIWPNQEKGYQKVEIQLNLILRRPDQSS